MTTRRRNQSEIASERCCVGILFQRLDKVKVISINYFYCFIVIGGAPFGSTFPAGTQARDLRHQGVPFKEKQDTGVQRVRKTMKKRGSQLPQFKSLLNEGQFFSKTKGQMSADNSERTCRNE